MSVHYKFKSSLDYDTVTFDGLHISVGDLKKSIIQQKKIGKSSDFDLQITNAQTKEVYKDDETLIPKNSSVVVARIPIPGASKKIWDRPEGSQQSINNKTNDPSSDGVTFDKLAKTADLTAINASEDDKIKAMMTQATQDYDPSKYMKIRGMTGPLPPNYLCYRCGKPGHWIKNCPTNSFEVKRSTGIPRSFMVTVEGPEVPGALLTNTGQFAVPVIDHEAYREGKKEKPPFAKEPSPEKEALPFIPEELLCMICRDLLSDAVLIPCCGNSYCDECVRQALLDSDEHECPTCHERDISPDTLIPNRFLRTAVMNFKNETGYTKVKKIVAPASPVATATVIPKPSEQVEEEQPAPSLPISQPSPSEPDTTLIVDDRPGTPVRDEHPDVDSATGTGGGLLPTPYAASEDQQIITGEGDSAPVNSTSTADTNNQFSIATITTRTTRHNFPAAMTPLPPFRPTRPPRNGSHPYSEGIRGPPPQLRGSGMQQMPRPYSPKHELGPHYHHHHHHHHSRHGFNPPHMYPSMPPPPSHHGSMGMPRNGPPPPPPLLNQPLLPLPPPPHVGHHYNSGPMPPNRGMGPRGQAPPGYPSQPPPPGALALGPPFEQPPPPGIPSAPMQHAPGYDFYRDHKNIREKDRAKNPFADFERELMEYKGEHNLRTRSSRSSSRSFVSSRSSSRSRSHSLSRSLSQSSRSPTRSRSYSYSRSRSSSASHSRSRSRSRSRSPYRSRARSRSHSRRYSPHYRRSRSPFPRTRSPFRRDYSPGYYNMYRYQTPMSSNYSPDHRGRFYQQHSYRFDDYHHHYGDQHQQHHQQHHQMPPHPPPPPPLPLPPPPHQHRYDAQEPPQYNPRVYDGNRYEDPHHFDKRSWTPEERERGRRESRNKGRVMEFGSRREEGSHSPHGLAKEIDKKMSQKRHHRSKNKREREHEYEAKSSKEHRSRKEGSKMEMEKYDKDDQEKRSRKSEKRGESSEYETKTKEKKHKNKSKKSQEQGKVNKQKLGKKSSSEVNPTSIAKENKSPKKQHQQVQQQQQELQEEDDVQQEKTSEESKRIKSNGEVEEKKVNPNIITIKPDPELKLMHIVKEADSTNNLLVADSTMEEDKSDVKEKEVEEEIVDANEPDSMAEIAETGDDEEEMEYEEEMETKDEEEEEREQKEEEQEEKETDESVLTAEIPELSKWEREESDLDEATNVEQDAEVVSKVAKTLPRDIVQRAEKAILHKVVKPTIMSNEKGEKKSKSVHEKSPKSRNCTSREGKEGKEVKDSTTLQITISGRDKRSVETKESGKEEEGTSRSKVNEKVKLDRSKFHEKGKGSPEKQSSSAVSVKKEVKAEEKGREKQVRSGNSSNNSSDLTKIIKLERHKCRDEHEEKGKRESEEKMAERKKAKQVERSFEGRSRRDERVRSSSKEDDGWSKGTRIELEVKERSERSRRGSTGRDEVKRDRRKSTIDESKFEPNYDETSDSEGERNVKKEEGVKVKRSGSGSPERETKRLKKGEMADKRSEMALTSWGKRERSVSLSSSASPSSAMSTSPLKKENKEKESPKHKHKKTKHKKHRKHKHKHKKRTHKSSKTTR